MSDPKINSTRSFNMTDMSSLSQQTLSTRQTAPLYSFSENSQFGMKVFHRLPELGRDSQCVSPNRYNPHSSKFDGRQTLSRSRSAPSAKFSAPDGDKRAKLLERMLRNTPGTPGPGAYGNTSRVRVSTEQTAPKYEFGSIRVNEARYRAVATNRNPGAGTYRFDKRKIGEGSYIYGSTIGGVKRNNSCYRHSTTGYVMTEPTKLKVQRTPILRECGLARCESTKKKAEQVSSVRPAVGGEASKGKRTDDVATGSFFGCYHPESSWKNTPRYTISGPTLEPTERVKKLREIIPPDHSPSPSRYATTSFEQTHASSTIANQPRFSFGQGYEAGKSA